MDRPQVEGRVGPSAFPGFVPDIITTPRRPLTTIVAAWLLSILGSMLISALVFAVMPQGEVPDFEHLREFGPGGILFALVVFAPLLETLIMGAVLLGLGLFMRPGYAVLVSAFLWALAHSAQAAMWGLVIWWPFLIFSTLFVVWRQRSLLAAFAIPFAVHMLQNLLPALSFAYPDVIPGI